MLRSLREAEGLTQAALAVRLGLTPDTVAGVEAGDDLPVSVIASYVEALGGQLDLWARLGNGRRVDLLRQGSTPGASTQLRLDDLLGIPSAPRRDVILSIRPPHAEKILSGDKTVELRRRFSAAILPGSVALIYVTSPVRALAGAAEIAAVQKLSLQSLWREHRAAACLPRADFDAYFNGLGHGYAILLGRTTSLPRPVGLPEMRERFGLVPPQSYQFAPDSLRELLENALAGHEQPQDPHRH